MVETREVAEIRVQRCYFEVVKIERIFLVEFFDTFSRGSRACMNLGTKY